MASNNGNRADDAKPVTAMEDVIAKLMWSEESDRWVTLRPEDARALLQNLIETSEEVAVVGQLVEQLKAKGEVGDGGAGLPD